MRVLADSHAVVWYLQGSDRLSPPAAQALAEAEETDGIVVSIATLVDLWYVTQTTRKLTDAHLAELRNALLSSAGFILQPIDLPVADATMSIARDLLADPWDPSSWGPPVCWRCRWSLATRPFANRGSCRSSGEQRSPLPSEALGVQLANALPHKLRVRSSSRPLRPQRFLVVLGFVKPKASDRLDASVWLSYEP